MTLMKFDVESDEELAASFLQARFPPLDFKSIQFLTKSNYL
jgi:hypothetical protein